jgi:hypothetical protein
MADLHAAFCTSRAARKLGYPAGRSRSGMPVALRDDHGPCPSREIRRSARQDGLDAHRLRRADQVALRAEVDRIWLICR